jgi:hypothetical protein
MRFVDKFRDTHIGTALMMMVSAPLLEAAYAGFTSDPKAPDHGVIGDNQSQNPDPARRVFASPIASATRSRDCAMQCGECFLGRRIFVAQQTEYGNHRTHVDYLPDAKRTSGMRSHRAVVNARRYWRAIRRAQSPRRMGHRKILRTTGVAAQSATMRITGIAALMCALVGVAVAQPHQSPALVDIAAENQIKQDQLPSNAARWLQLPNAIEYSRLREQLAIAQSAFNRADCPQATEAAIAAVTSAASLQALGSLGGNKLLTVGLRIALRCADKSGDSLQAFAWARLLTIFAPTSDPDAELLARYPSADTTTTTPLLIPISAVAATGISTVSIDNDTPIRLPATLVIASGLHLVTVTNQQHAVSQLLNINKEATITINLPVDQPAFADSLQDAPATDILAKWRDEPVSAIRFPTAQEQQVLITALFTLTKSNQMIVFTGNQTAIWHRDQQGVAVLKHPWQERTAAQLVSLTEQPKRLPDKIPAKDRRAPASGVDLLLDSTVARRKPGAKAEDKTEWWVYATIAGAALIGGAALYAHDSMQDQQRITVRWQP